MLFLLFLKASLFSTGGFSNLPSLHQDLTANGWAKETDFGQSLAIGQISQFGIRGGGSTAAVARHPLHLLGSHVLNVTDRFIAQSCPCQPEGCV